MAIEEHDMQDDELDDLEMVSALADGQLGDAEFDAVADAMGDATKARAAWHAYHVIGDVLRGGDVPDCSGDMAFVARLRTQLAESGHPATLPQALSVDRPHGVSRPVAGAVTVVRQPGGRGANDPAVRWKWLAAAASLAAVAVLGWNVTKPGTDAGARLAQGKPAQAQQAIAAASEQPPVMLRDPRLDELLAAHRQYGGASALPTVAGFLRNATFEQPER
jgi:sigma-E factor negative regulatory protein RseA